MLDKSRCLMPPKGHTDDGKGAVPTPTQMVLLRWREGGGLTNSNCSCPFWLPPPPPSAAGLPTPLVWGP